MPDSDRGGRLRGRHHECAALAALVENVRAGHSGVLVLHGEPGFGKSALLDFTAECASGCRVARVHGDESEMELAFAALHLICAPMLEHLDRISVPQRNALSTAFGLSSGEPPNRFFVGLAVLSLLAEVAEDQPLVCLIDDAQWLDHASAAALSFVARRLLAERVGMVFARRDGVEARAISGLPEMPVHGLSDADARAMLDDGLHAPLDPAVRKRILADAHGNPLALLELPRTMTPTEMAGGFGLPSTMPVSGRIEAEFTRRIAALPSPTQRLMLVAAAEPVGDPVVLWRAAHSLGIDGDAATPAIEDGLVETSGRVVFRHPLVRSAVYRFATATERREVHRALADATDAAVDPDRRAWHRAHAAAEPDEGVAGELERAASRAQARGGLAAAAAFLERSVDLTTDPTQGLERTLAAIEANLEAGGLEAALKLLASVDTEPLDPLARARVDLMRGRTGFIAGDGTVVPKLLLDAARRLEPLDLPLARETYLEALSTASYAGRFTRDVDVLEVARAARAAPARPGPVRALDLLLEGLTLLVTAELSDAAPALRRAVNAFRSVERPVADDLRHLGLACATACATWDYESWYTLASRDVQITRETGALTMLPIGLNNLVILLLCEGDLDGAAVLVAEAEAINEATGNQYAPYAATYLAALRGRERDAMPVIEATVADAVTNGRGHVLRFAMWASATLYNGLAQYEHALAAAQEADAQPEDWARHNYLHELIEAATRAGQPAIASAALERLSQTAQALGTDWPLGIEARCRALLSEPIAAEALFREAIRHLERTPLRFELARAHLLYGEWLRRENRRIDARRQLRTAHDAFVAMGTEGFATRAGRELMATGEKVRKRALDNRDELTAQEAQIARLAAEGRTNPEIGAELYISARTVEWHLRKVYPKLGISSRRDLRKALPARRSVGPSA